MTDIQIMRDLAARVAEIAALPKQEETRRLWRKLNGLNPERPMVTIDQICWNEMHVDDELTLRCQDEKYRHWEERLRQIIYQWKHFPVDMVVDDFVRVPKAVYGLGFGVQGQEQMLATDTTNNVLSHAYRNQFNSMEDLDKIKMPVVIHDTAETARRQALAEEIFDGSLSVRMEGVDPYLSVWDPIATWMGVENAMLAMADDPDMMRAMAEKVTAGYMYILDQLTEQGLLCGPQSLIHCTGAFTDELNPAEAAPEAAQSAAPEAVSVSTATRTTTQNLWMFGLAQMFSSVSPAMFDAFEIDICMPLFARFGLVYYGCCDPLDLKMDQVRRIPHLRKVSMSPWASKERGAAAIAGDYVFSAKPNPAFLGFNTFDEAVVQKDLSETVHICKQYNCSLELIQKDISTVKYQPQRLWRWAEIAMQEVMQ